MGRDEVKLGLDRTFAVPFNAHKKPPTHCAERPYGASKQRPRDDNPQAVVLNGAGARTRTADLTLTRRLLYQLSYAGMARNPDQGKIAVPGHGGKRAGPPAPVGAARSGAGPVAMGLGGDASGAASG